MISSHIWVNLSFNYTTTGPYLVKFFQKETCDSFSNAKCIVQSPAKAKVPRQQHQLAELRWCSPKLQTFRVPPLQRREETVSTNIKIFFYQKYL